MAKNNVDFYSAQVSWVEIEIIDTKVRNVPETSARHRRCSQHDHVYKHRRCIRWSKTIVGQVDLTAKLCLSFCLELQSAKSTYQHVDLAL